MILDIRQIKRDGKLVWQKYVCYQWNSNEGYLEFKLKDAGWQDIEVVEEVKHEKKSASKN